MRLDPSVTVAGTRRPRPLSGVVPDRLRQLRRNPPPQPLALACLVVGTVAMTLACVSFSEAYFPPATLAIPLLAGGLLLTMRPFRQLAVVVAASLVVDVADLGIEEARPGAIVMLVLTGIVSHEYARSREGTGLGGLTADSVLVELRNRLEQQGELPSLPRPWRAESVVRPAGGGPFAGDFVVSAVVDGTCFVVALVDVSGKGVDAGTRSLLLSGAMGGLLNAQKPEEFLSAANAYLVRQHWDEGFATAVHLTLGLDSGEFAVGSAGHPPVAHFDAGSGRWGLVEAEGPALGLLPDVEYKSAKGVLRPGDALLLYTDGLVEVPGRDLDVGIDKLLGEAERLVTRGFAGGGEVLIDNVAPQGADDRGLVLIWRSGR
jgi:hypothetical protein